MFGKRVRIGIAGCGDLTVRGLLPHLSEPDAKAQASVVAVCDTDFTRARLTAERFGLPRSYDCYDAMLEDAELELVVVATPMVVHAQQAKAALRKGLHVYLQKPIGINVSEADEVIEVAAQSRAKVLVAPLQRLCLAYAQIKAALERGEIGAPFWALTVNHSPHDVTASGVDRTWFLLRGAGPVRDRGIYSLTTLTDLFGPVRTVSAQSNLRMATNGLGQKGKPADDNTVLLLGFAENVLGVSASNYCQQGRLIPSGFLGIYGRDGSIETTGVDPSTWYATELEIRTARLDGSFQSRVVRCPLSEQPHLAGAHAHLPEAQAYADLMHLVDCIANDREPLPTLSQARHMVEVIEKAYLAAETGMTQTVESRF